MPRKHSRPGPGPIIDLPPPSPEVKANVERYIIKLLARRTLEEMGILPASSEGEVPPRRTTVAPPLFVSTTTHRKLLRLTRRLERDGWSAHAIDRNDTPTVDSVLDEALGALTKQLRRVPRRRA